MNAWHAVQTSGTEDYLWLSGLGFLLSFGFRHSLFSPLVSAVGKMTAALTGETPVPLQNYFSLAKNYFARQSVRMETNRAEEHLQTIRTLMERSAVYRRALAPIMVWNGLVGVAGGLLGWGLGFISFCPFIAFWSAAAVLAMIGSFLLIRRQALKDSEPFWSPPTRRVAQALLPPLLIGGFVNTYFMLVTPWRGDVLVWHYLVTILWLWLYGCAACSAGFFMPRGIKLFGWFFISIGCVFFIVIGLTLQGGGTGIYRCFWFPYLLMGSIFGGLHLAYGVYLYVTEKRKQAA